MQIATSPSTTATGAVRGARIVLTAPLTEIIDHAGYFIQMSMASLPMWLEGILNKKYPTWRNVEYNADGSARYMPAGVRVLEASLLRHYPAGDIACDPTGGGFNGGPGTGTKCMQKATSDLLV